MINMRVAVASVVLLFIGAASGWTLGNFFQESVVQDCHKQPTPDQLESIRLIESVPSSSLRVKDIAAIVSNSISRFGEEAGSIDNLSRSIHFDGEIKAVASSVAIVFNDDGNFIGLIKINGKIVSYADDTECADVDRNAIVWSVINAGDNYQAVPGR